MEKNLAAIAVVNYIDSQKTAIFSAKTFEEKVNCAVKTIRSLVYLFSSNCIQLDDCAVILSEIVTIARSVFISSRMQQLTLPHIKVDVPQLKRIVEDYNNSEKCPDNERGISRFFSVLFDVFKYLSVQREDEQMDVFHVICNLIAKFFTKSGLPNPI